MNCERVREHLSAYYDGELRGTIQQDIDSHLKQCPECQQVLSSYKRLSSLFEGIPSSTGAQPTAQDWDSLQAKLGATVSSAVPSVSSPSRRVSTSRILLAACLLLGVAGVIWLTQQPRPTHADGNLDLRQFVVDFQSNPNEAQTRLVANFQGRAVTPEEAAEVLKRRPVFLDRVPKDLQLVSLNLLKMPCCTCPQGVYRTPSGRIVCIFEHESKAGILAGNCPMIESRCCGRDVKLGEVGGVLLASWRSKESSITAVGLESMEEVIELIGSFNLNESQG